MFDFLRRNTTTKIISLMLALVLWLYVGNLQNPYGERVFSQVPIEVENLPANLIVEDMPKTVALRVQGERTLLNGLNNASFKTWVNLDKAVAGNNAITVSVKAPGNLHMVKVEPGRVNVKIAELDEQLVNVRAKVVGSPKQGYELLDATVTPSQVTVRGPKSLLKVISHIEAPVKVSGISSNVTPKVVLRAIDKKGQAVKGVGLKIEPETAEVFVPVVPRQPHKAVKVLPNLQGSPAEGYQIEQVYLDRQQVTILGNQASLDSVASLATEPININNATQDIVKQVRLVGVDKVSLVGPPTVRVVVKIKAATIAETTEAIPLTIKGQASGQVTLANQNVNVTWLKEGTAKPLAWIDVTGLTPGEHTVQVHTEVKAGTIYQVTPREVTVVVGNPEENTNIGPEVPTEAH